MHKIDPCFGAAPIHVASNRGANDIIDILLSDTNVDLEIRDSAGMIISSWHVDTQTSISNKVSILFQDYLLYMLLLVEEI